MSFQPPSRNLADDSISAGGRVQRFAYLPLLQSCDSIQRLYRLTHELGDVWQALDAEESERFGDTDAIIKPALAEVENRLLAWQQRHSEMEMQCAKHLAKLESAESPVDQSLEIAAAKLMPMRKQLQALERLANFSVLGAARAELLAALDRPITSSGQDFATLESEVGLLKSEVNERRRTVMILAEKAQATWQELGEVPHSEDEILMTALAANSAAAAIQISDAALSAVERSAATWDARRAEVAAEVARLHATLHGFDASSNIDDFIKEHGTLHSTDRAACSGKLKELQCALRSENTSRHERISYLYDVTGMGRSKMNDFYKSLDEQAGSSDLWREHLLQEVTRMEVYHRSLQGVLTQLEELHALVLEGSRFATAKKVSEVPSLHFLEQEKYSKLLARRYPPIHDKLLSDIEQWEASSSQCLIYHGAVLRDKLVAARKFEADPVRGTLAVIEPLLQIFSSTNPTLATSAGSSLTEGSVASRRPSSASRRPSSASRCTTPSRTPVRSATRPHGS
eukprot:TRINITY_DN53941_c0_g1_i1.p1 TRINITY_DN53941_c0_g1~~TRINITY_DN53941_c0_g1_i1.p1  ORF type:complete len:521 (-),score=91.40 TRINITY_DN53941_c0_g1_i1:78-1616(-)